MKNVKKLLNFWNKKIEYTFILSYPHKEGKFILDTVACLYDIGAVLSQIQIENCEEKKVIAYAYASKTLSKKWAKIL